MSLTNLPHLAKKTALEQVIVEARAFEPTNQPSARGSLSGVWARRASVGFAALAGAYFAMPQLDIGRDGVANNSYDANRPAVETSVKGEQQAPFLTALDGAAGDTPDQGKYVLTAPGSGYNIAMSFGSKALADQCIATPGAELGDNCAPVSVTTGDTNVPVTVNTPVTTNVPVSVPVTTGSNTQQATQEQNVEVKGDKSYSANTALSLAGLAQAGKCNASSSFGVTLGVILASGGISWANADPAGTPYLRLGGKSRSAAIAELYEEDGQTKKAAYAGISDDDIRTIDCLLGVSEELEKGRAHDYKLFVEGNDHQLKLTILENDYKIIFRGMAEYCPSEKKIKKIIHADEHDKYCHKPIDEAMDTVKTARKALWGAPRAPVPLAPGS